MNESEDRPTSSDRPGPYGDPPEASKVPYPQGGPPADPVPTAGEPAPAPPAATWEDVVDPLPEPPPAPAGPSTIALPSTTPPLPPPPAAPPPSPPEPAQAAAPAPAPAPSTERAPAPAPAAPAPRRATTAVEDEAAADADEYDDYDDEPASRWVSLIATVGTALIGIVTVQVLASLVEGLTLKSGQRVGVPDDLLHRLGYPFGGLGATALIFLVLGVVLMAMPNVLDELLSESQDRVVGIALLVSIVMSVIIAVGSLLAVRANLHEYAAKNVAVPSYVRVQFTNFLLGSLGAAALSLFGAIAAMNERRREAIDVV